MTLIRIATRMSDLAMIQAEHIKRQLQGLYPDMKVEFVKIKTQGDKILDTSLSKIGGKGLFIKELQQAMFDDEADIAVHCVKDLPYEQTPGLTLAAIGFREDPRDVFLSRDGTPLMDLKKGAKVGTSSLRRQMQLLRLRPDLDCQMLRGNVPTRCDKLKRGEYDAIILAAAGLHRLKLDNLITHYLPVDDFLPAVGQGALGIECKEDKKIIELLAPLHDAKVASCILAERAMNRHLKGSCSVPIAGYATLQNNQITLTGRVGMPDGQTMIEAKHIGHVDAPEVLGQKVADDLTAQGAKDMIRACSQHP